MRLLHDPGEFRQLRLEIRLELVGCAADALVGHRLEALAHVGRGERKPQRNGGGSEAPSLRGRRRPPVGRNGRAGEDRTPILRKVTRADQDRAIRLTLVQEIFPAGERLDLLPMLLECRLRPQPIAIGKMIVERLA